MPVLVMAKFTINVVRIEYAAMEIEVEADNLEDANDIALNKAYSEHFDSASVYDVEYKVAGI